MKKHYFAALILALVLALAGSSAESIFPTIPEEGTEESILTAPSYGKMADAAPERVEQNAEGGTIVTYAGVDASGYNSFGVYLGGLGYSVTGQEEQGDRTAYAVSDGRVSFVMIYDRAARTMQLVYPKGTEYDESLFPGYTRIEPGKEITVPELGVFVFKDFKLGTKVRRAAYFGKYFGDVLAFGKEKTVNCVLAFSYYNSTAEDKHYFHDPNDLLEATLVYKSADAVYEFAEDSHGRYRGDLGIYATGVRKKASKYDVLDNYTVPPLNVVEEALGFDLPDTVGASEGGTIAVRLDFKTGEKYLLVFRKDGKDLTAGAGQAK